MGELLKLNETMFLSLLLFSLTEAEHRVGPNGEWDYHDGQGSDWVDLKGTSCASEIRQSPIDLRKISYFTLP